MKLRSRRPRPGIAFTLLEVMLAMLLFFMAIFAILEVVTMCLRNARLLQRPTVSTTAVAAWLSLTNRLSEGSQSGDFKDLLGDNYDAFRWDSEITEITNRLYEVQFAIIEQTSKGANARPVTIWLFRPDSTAGTGPRGFR